jgi:3-oxoacyl-[acyl-carrier protein] reductase
MGRFEGKPVIVTGGASGFGRATALRFAEEGARVLVADLNSAGADETTSMIADAGGVAESIACNVAIAADVAAMVERAVAAFGKIDVLVNNAGYCHMSRLMWKITEEEFDGGF